MLFGGFLLKKYKRTTLKAFRLDVDLLEQIEEMMEIHGWNNLSDFIRNSAVMMIKLEKMRPIMNDPEQWKRFQEEMDAQLSEESIFDYVSSLDDTKLLGFKQALDMERESRVTRITH